MSEPYDIPPPERTWISADDARRPRGFCVIVAVLAAVLTVIGAVLDTRQFLRSYLMAFFYWWCVALGSLGLMMVGYVAPGKWTVMLRRPFEAASRTILPLGVLFLPIAIGVKVLYPWAAPPGSLEPAVTEKAGYLNVPFFIVRAVIYFAVWAWTGRSLARLTAEQDRTRDVALMVRMRRIAGPGLVAYFLALTFASVDWTMSLRPDWWSTIYPIYVLGGQGVSAMCLGIVTAWLLVRRPAPAPALFTARHFHDFGKMLLAWVMLWAYFALSQFLIIWSGNLPDEIPYYIVRMRSGWQWVSFFLVLFHFAVPFFLLLSKDLKLHPAQLAGVAILLLVMRWVDVYWLVSPAFSEQVTFHWLDVTAFLAVGGAWVALYVTNLASRPLIPIGEPTLPEVLSHGA